MSVIVYVELDECDCLSRSWQVWLFT